MKPVIRVDKLSKNYTLVVEIKVTKVFKLRYWVAITLIKLAAYVLGCGIELRNLDKIRIILNRCRIYVVEANQRAEAKHDSPDTDKYMDGGQYEIMQETEELIKDIDQALEENP